MSFRLAPVLLALGGLVNAAPAPPAARLTLDAIYGEHRVDFSGAPPTALQWLDDGRWLQKSGGVLEVVDRVSGRRTPFVDRRRLADALADSGVPAPEAGRLADAGDFEIATGGAALLVTSTAGLIHYDVAAGRARKLAPEAELPALSPDGRKVAFVRAHDLYVVDVSSGAEQRLTHDGSPDVLNGKLDWIYQEEVYGRGNFRSFWWSPDSQRLAFLRLDETKVPRFTIVDERTSRAESLPYPKPGDPNPGARLGIVSASGGPVTWVPLAADDGERLVVAVGWSRDGRHVVAQVQDRTQTCLDVVLADAATGAARVVLHEQAGAWMEPSEGPYFLDDGRFVWPSERTGFRHLYLVERDGSRLRPLTAGRFEVRSVRAVDEKRGFVYFTANERTPSAEDLYRVRLDGTGFERLSTQPGFHVPVFAPGFGFYLDTWSRVHQPPQVRLHASGGEEVRVVHAPDVEALRAHGVVAPELVQVKARDGFVLEGLLLRPAGLEPGRRYPVYHHVYSSPRAPKVVDRWAAKDRDHLFFQLLAQRGVGVFLLDNRSASGKGLEAAWPVRGRLGELELQDIEDGIDWLVQQPWVDASRIGIEGWSGGGFMTLYALTHSRRFAMGIAGGSVVDWREYDSIWTERHMGLPTDNAEGYARTAPVREAERLEAPLLLVHGTADDNVHAENTLRMADALQQAGKPFRMMLYPGQRHTFDDPAAIRHLRQLMLDFVDETLCPPGAARPCGPQLDSARRP